MFSFPQHCSHPPVCSADYVQIYESGSIWALAENVRTEQLRVCEHVSDPTPWDIGTVYQKPSWSEDITLPVATLAVLLDVEEQTSFFNEGFDDGVSVSFAHSFTFLYFAETPLTERLATAFSRGPPTTHTGAAWKQWLNHAKNFQSKQGADNKDLAISALTLFEQNQKGHPDDVRISLSSAKGFAKVCNAEFDFSDLEIDYASAEAVPRPKSKAALAAAAEKAKKKGLKPGETLPPVLDDNLEGLLGCTLEEVKNALEPVEKDVKTLLEIKDSFDKGIDALQQSKSDSQGGQGAELAKAQTELHDSRNKFADLQALSGMLVCAVGQMLDDDDEGLNSTERSNIRRALMPTIRALIGIAKNRCGYSKHELEQFLHPLVTSDWPKAWALIDKTYIGKD
jgi:hypothetical protein